VPRKSRERAKHVTSLSLESTHNPADSGYSRMQDMIVHRLVCCSPLLILAVLTGCVGRARPPEKRLQSAMEKRLRQFDVKGASAAFILPDGCLRTATAGVSHGNVRISPDMAFSVGSITKNMVAALVLRLAEDGKLSLEDPVSAWLPPAPHVDGAITIRQLLNHTSGIYMFFENQQLWDDLIKDRTKVFTPQEVLGYLREPYFAPGRGFRYSNTNYLLAAMIVEKATGSTLAVELRKHFWQPLGLTSARLPLEEPYPETLAHVWGDNFEKGGAYRDITFLPRVSHDSIGCPSVFMTAGDLARWTHALFHGRVLRRESLVEMEAFGQPGSYGLGLQRFPRLKTAGQLAFGHGGGSIGTEAFMVYLPEHGVCFALMINRFGGRCSSRLLRDLGGITMMQVKPSALFLSFRNLQSWMALAWVVVGAGLLIHAARKGQPLVLIVFGGIAVLAGWISNRQALLLEFILVPEGALLAAIGFVLFIRKQPRTL
jgi:D-alanyl-D-alanine carboxypeptidase